MKRSGFAIVLAPIIILATLAFIFFAIFLFWGRNGTLTFATGFAVGGENGVGCPDKKMTEFFWSNSSINQAIINNRKVYEEAGAAYGVDWKYLAAIHYRETTFNQKGGADNGQGPFQLTSKYFNAKNKGDGAELAKILDFNESAKLAAQVLKEKAKAAGYEGPLNDGTSPDIIRNTFYRYNSLVEHSSALASPFVMNKYGPGYDSPSMLWPINHPRADIAGKPDGERLGTFVVYSLLKTANIDMSARKITWFANCGGGGMGAYVCPVDTGKANAMWGDVIAQKNYKIPTYPNHEGLDITGTKGDPIFSASDGEVISAKTEGYKNGSSVNRMTIKEKDGVYWYYDHFETIEPVVVNGAKITKGQKLGTMGTANNVIHLHLGVAKTSENLTTQGTSPRWDIWYYPYEFMRAIPCLKPPAAPDVNYP